MFNDDYYEGTDQDNVKPVFEDLDDDFNYEDDDDYNNNNNNNEEDIMMDADYLPGGDKYEEHQQSKNNKGKGKAKANNYESTESFKDNNNKNIKDKEYNKLMDEYYSLDFEDVIGGDIATRYKYIQTEPEDFGMTAEEILLADDTELNKVISVKSLAP